MQKSYSDTHFHHVKTQNIASLQQKIRSLLLLNSYWGKFEQFLKIVLIYSLLWSVELQAQTIPVGTPVLEDVYRRMQLLGELDSTFSFCSRPFFPMALNNKKDEFDPDSSLSVNRFTKFDGILRFGKDKGIIKLLPVTWIQQYNSVHPAGINDGAMIPARGYQTLFSAGVYAQYGPLSIQLRPEIVYAENKVFQGFPGIQPGETPPILRSQIDLPERFGDKAYHKLFWGQSSIRLTFGAISMGLSNENLWWGPGMQNALLMTNNAPGFNHFTLNTVKPIRTPIGSFEWQIICGRLDSSEYSVSKSNNWRYLNGVVITYQPKWIPGLFLGATRSLMSYGKGLKTINEYLPVFIPLSKKSDGGASEDALGRDQLASLFLRWLWTEEHGEIYFEYGREDHAWDIRDYLLQASHSAAYIIGFNKLIPLKARKGEYIQLNMELTELESSSTTINRGWTIDWYTHTPITEGYTNLGQVLGAGIGPGSNLQTVNISWVKSLKMIGIQFERFVHNNNYQYDAIQDIRKNWVDLSAALVGNWNYKNLIFNVKLQFIQEKNYEWQYKPILTVPQQYWNPTNDYFNFHGQLGITYRF